MENYNIVETSINDLEDIQKLWADGDVMKFVGFPNGLHETMDNLQKWYKQIEKLRPKANHFSIFDGDTYCGESFYQIDFKSDNATCLDIKLFNHARGKGIATYALLNTIKEAFKNGASKVWVDPNPNNLKAIALYERLGFIRKQMPDYLIESEGTNVVYMEKEAL